MSPTDVISLSHTLSLYLPLPLTHTVSPSHRNINSVSFSPSLSHTHSDFLHLSETHTLFLSPFLSLSHTHSLSGDRRGSRPRRTTSARRLSWSSNRSEFKHIRSSYTEVYSVTYDAGSVPRRAIFSPRETLTESINRFKQARTRTDSNRFKSDSTRCKQVRSQTDTGRSKKVRILFALQRLDQSQAILAHHWWA